MEMTEMVCWICGQGDGEIVVTLGHDDDSRPHHTGCVSLLHFHEWQQLKDRREAEYMARRFRLDPATAERFARECETYRRAGVFPADLR